MAQHAPDMKLVLKQLRRKVQPGEGSGTPDHRPISAPDLVPPPSDPKKSKRKEKAAKSSRSPRRSPKRSKPSSSSLGANSALLFGGGSHVAKGVSISLPSSDKEAIGSAPLTDILSACVELQSRALVLAKVIEVEAAKSSPTEAERLRKELSESASSLKAALEANSQLVAKVESAEAEQGALADELKSWKAKYSSLQQDYADLERSEASAVGDLKELEQHLTEMTLAREETHAAKVKAEAELLECQRYVLGVHEEGFNQAVRQAAFFYGVPLAEGKFDIGKDVYEGRLMAVEDVPTGADEAAAGD